MFFLDISWPKCLKRTVFKPLGHRFMSFKPYDQFFELLPNLQFMPKK